MTLVVSAAGSAVATGGVHAGSTGLPAGDALGTSSATLSGCNHQVHASTSVEALRTT
jgi:hypothetical protein